jgi:N-acetylglucosaminyldiphosphoundecaprenol N-acetyl-beta-D-mannosaminyltransferase
MNDMQAAQVAPADSNDLLVPATATRRELDLGRDVHALLGLVFDRIDLAQAADRLRSGVDEARRCAMSTPNVNFVATAMQDPMFRGSVLRSDLSVADGFPIVRIARWMGIDLPGRVAGSDLFDRLQSMPPSGQGRIKLFLFGGPPGVGARAQARINEQRLGFECVGHDEGGWGDVESMSSQALIDRINASGAEFILVALGAKKGQGWVDHNRYRLKAAVMSHLGAVINFAAQSVARAPRWMQRCGLEWLWRIYEEPQLWRRYWNDGRVLLRALAMQVLPWLVRQRLGMAPPGAEQPARFDIERCDGTALFKLSGDWRNMTHQGALRLALTRHLRQGERVQFDLSAAPAIGSALVGMLTLVDAWQHEPRAVRAATITDPRLLADLRAFGAQHLLQPRA